MKKSEIEIYCDETNRAIVRMPNRNFPGYVIQGDSLSTLYWLAKSIYKRARTASDTELTKEAERLFRSLDSTIRHYESVLDEHGFQIPYHPNVVLKDLLDWQQGDNPGIKPEHE